MPQQHSSKRACLQVAPQLQCSRYLRLQQGVPAEASPARAPPGQLAAREPADLVWSMPEGRITYYRHGYFTCLCQLPNHHKCVMTRSAKAGSRPAQGRPLAFLYAWLQSGKGLPDKACHWDPIAWPNLAARQAARTHIQDVPEAAALLAKERTQRPGEGAEPETRP